jgi:hypothetical protein
MARAERARDVMSLVIFLYVRVFLVVDMKRIC